MSAEKRRVRFTPITPVYRKNKHSDAWFSTGTAIILISIIIAIVLGSWLVGF